MADVPNFLSFHCNNSPETRCADCPRDFTMPMTAIESISKDTNWNAIISIIGTHSMPHIRCIERLRFIDTAINYDTFIAALDGEVYDCGNVNLVDRHDIV